jgi:hypothetical protein
MLRQRQQQTSISTSLFLIEKVKFDGLRRPSRNMKKPPPADSKQKATGKNARG